MGSKAAKGGPSQALTPTQAGRYARNLAIPDRAIDIFPVTCQEMSKGRTNLEVLDAVMAAGAGIIQMREKNWKKKAIHDLALEFRKRTYGQQILLIISDHVDIALAVDADGVHLGQEDLPIAAHVGLDLV
ncbi:thiamine phosphate synthase [Desulfococcus sp.]|uniref:thiamine phosphate synthase n=1 Tax=Desulfococcus sp. TaxID=2025834 RepID=UPI003593C031